MTVANDVSRIEYNGNGVTVAFVFPFRIMDPTALLVYVGGVQRFDLTISGGETDAGGVVTLATAPPSGQNVWLIRDTPDTQPYDLHEFDTMSAEAQERSFDRITLLLQELDARLDRALHFSDTVHLTGISTIFPMPGAGECIKYNAAGTALITAPCAGGSGGGGGDLSGDGLAGQVTFWTGTTSLAGDAALTWDNSVKALTVGTTPLGPLKPGNAFMGLQGPSNDVGMQNLMLQTVQGDPSLIGLVTLGDDRVGISSWNFRGTGAANPIYGANFGVVFNTNGVANGLEIDVQNDSATNYQGQALWLNGSTRSTSSAGHRANAILIDTQDGSKWERGILFKEGFVANGATGSIEKMGIHFEHSQDADFIVIQPRVGTAANVAMKLTNPEFSLNRFELLNSGTLRVSNSMTGPAFPSYSFIEGAGPTAGMYLEDVGTPAVPAGPGGIPPAVPAAGSILGWAVNSARRLTLGDALNVWPTGTGTGQGGTINLFDPTSVHSVGFMAPDFVGTSFRIRLPSAPGASGQCVITSGGSPIETWSYGACGTGVGGGGTVTNTGVLATNTLILGNSGVDVKPLGSLGTTTTVLHGNVGGAPTWTQVMIPDIGATGTPSSTTFLRGDGTWNTPAGSGTVTTSGVPLTSQVAFFTGPSAISGDAHFQWSNAGKTFHVGLANDLTSVSQVATFAGRSTGGSDPVALFYAAFAGASPTVNHPVGATFVGDFTGGTSMPVGFGTTIELALHDYAGPGLFIPAASITATVQTLTPASTMLTFSTQAAGVVTPLLLLDGGQAHFTRQVRSQVPSSINPVGGTLVASKSYAGGAIATNDGLGAVIFTGEGMIPAIAQAAAQILGNVDATGGTRIKGRLTFHTSDGTSLLERMRIGSDGVVALSGRLVVEPSVNTENSIYAAVSTAATGGAHYPLWLVAASTGQITDGFGPAILFSGNDQDAIVRHAGSVGYRRAGPDDTWLFAITTTIAGASADRLTINGSGQATYWPTASVGSFQLAAAGTRRTELQFFTNNNAQAVSFIAPGSATGNPIWILPSSLGAAGSILTNDGAGLLSWTTNPQLLGLAVLGSVGAQQYFAAGLPGFSGTKTLGTCVMTVTGGIITSFTGGPTC